MIVVEQEEAALADAAVGFVRVELGYLDPHHNQVRITGVAEVVTDRALLQEIWDANPLLRQYLGSVTNPDLIVYRIDPSQVRYMQEHAKRSSRS